MPKKLRLMTGKVYRRTDKKYKRKVLKRLRKVAANARAALQRRRKTAKQIATRRNLLTALQIAKRFRVTPQAVYLWRKGGLRAVRVSSLLLFSLKRVEQYLLYHRRR